MGLVVPAVVKLREKNKEVEPLSPIQDHENVNEQLQQSLRPSPSSGAPFA